MQLQKSIGNILGRPFQSLGTALLAARQVQKASNSAKHVRTPNTAQDQYFSTSLSSEDDPVSGAERVQQQNVELVRHQLVGVPVLQVFNNILKWGHCPNKVPRRLVRTSMRRNVFLLSTVSIRSLVSPFRKSMSSTFPPKTNSKPP